MINDQQLRLTLQSLLSELDAFQLDNTHKIDAVNLLTLVFFIGENHGLNHNKPDLGAYRLNGACIEDVRRTRIDIFRQQIRMLLDA